MILSDIEGPDVADLSQCNQHCLVTEPIFVTDGRRYRAEFNRPIGGSEPGRNMFRV